MRAFFIGGDNLKKFWNKAETTNEILIYGEIVSENIFDSDVTAKNFADDLKSFGGKNVTLRINSGGGDVFAATAISNVIKSYSGKISCTIDGLAASAATIITSACAKVSIAKNALFMVHDPAVGLIGYFDENEVAKVQKSLAAVKSSIVETYKQKTGKSENELAEIMKNETWYTAAEALENKFVDEISGEVDADFDDSKKILFVNSLQVDCKNFDVEKMKNKLEVRKMSDKTDKTKEPAKVDIVAEIREKEISRIRDLNNLKTGNKIVDGIVDVAIKEGATVEEIQKYINVVAKNQEKEPETVTAANIGSYFAKIIQDNLKSGAEGVTGSTPPVDDETEKRTAQAKMLADMANGLI